MKHINEEQHPYGFNTIVAIMSYNGYNVEDAILINEGSLNRGLFHTTYYNMYEAYEEVKSLGKSRTNTVIKSFSNETNIMIKPGYNYNELDNTGIIRENTLMDDKKVVIGRVTFNEENIEERSDASVTPKKGQLGYVDKTYITEEMEGKRIAKVRIREQRIPSIGDKFCSRCGQKGTIGAIIPECDMPFTKDGVKPDIIINPHAIPSRMTIGQLVESIMTNVGLKIGCGMDSTPYTTDKGKIENIGNILNDYGMHSSGNEFLYNGMTGDMIEHSIFIGPTYYLRLKHMTKDKINYRSSGARTLLTRQTNQGRANDGGLRIGEMERDGMIAHGCTSFIKDSMMNRGDKYKMAICNHSGTLAIYNQQTKHLYSPIIDGPIKFDIEGKEIVHSQMISQYGKDFTIVEVPYCFKLLMQELSAMNVQMRLITSSTIDSKESFASAKLSEIVKNANKIVNENANENEEEESNNGNEEEESNNGNEEEESNENEEEESNENEEEKKNGNEEEKKNGNKEEINDLEIVYNRTKFDKRVLAPNDLNLWKEIITPDNTVIYKSTILDETGTESEISNERPNFYPKLWNIDQLNNLKLNSKMMAESLIKNQVSNNWNLSLIHISEPTRPY